MKYTVHREMCELSCEVQGIGEPILLIHGVACDSSFYKETADILKNDFRVITYDRRGYAKGRISPGASFSVREQAADAAAVLDGAGVSSAVVAGCSAGGIIALEMAYRYPKRVRKLFLHEPPLGMEPVYQEAVGQWRTKLEADAQKKRLIRALLDFISVLGGVDPLAGSTTMEQQSQNLENLKIFLNEEIGDFLTYHERLSKMRRLEMPCVLTAGTEDAEGLFSQSGPSAAEWLGCSFMRVPGYHNLASDRPEVFAEILKNAVGNVV